MTRIDPPAAHFAAVPQPIARRTLPELVLERVRDMIIEGQLAPGDRINEGELGARLGVSRTPLREALRSLASEGLIELVPSRGALVRRFTAKDVRDVLDVLAMLEAKAGRLAVARASDVDIAALRALHDEMMGLYARRDRLPYFKLNQAFHSGLVALSGNSALVQCHTQLQSGLKRIRYIGNEAPQAWAGAVAEHEAMIAALERRDADALAAVLETHMDGTWERVCPFL
jgi:DNA-binding GntR family transcriptional regulator